MASPTLNAIAIAGARYGILESARGCCGLPGDGSLHALRRWRQREPRAGRQLRVSPRLNARFQRREPRCTCRLQRCSRRRNARSPPRSQEGTPPALRISSTGSAPRGLSCSETLHPRCGGWPSFVTLRRVGAVASRVQYRAWRRHLGSRLSQLILGTVMHSRNPARRSHKSRMAVLL